ncbi:MAG: hypothetical protein D3920_13010, partial [Candidatus Electrothrix sp. AW2]|nr:hypothetical protein [Candidatus Electrothrix gigas]
WDTWTPSGGYGAYPYPGETVRTQGIWYDMGNVGAGFDNDNDGVPDKNAWMQPVGDPSLYDAGCFRLVRTYGIVIVKKQDGSEELIPFVDQLYFEHIPDNTGAVGLVFYEYAALNGVCRGALSPYQEVASGYDNEKFSGDYGAAIQMETKAPLASMSKNAYATTSATDPVGLQDPVLNLSGGDQMLVYQLEITNPDSYTSGGQGLIVPIGDPLLGVPVVARDSIPEGTVFVSGTAKFIANGDGVTKNGTILFSTDNGVSWSSTEPSDPTTVTDIEWWLDESLTSDATNHENTMKVEFRVKVPTSYPAATKPYVSNVGCAAFGAGPCFDEDDAKTFIEGENTIEGYVWKDVDSTTNPDFYGDGIMNGTEAGDLSGVPIQVYFDSDHPDSTPGQLDSYDTLWEDKDTTGAALTTDSNGYYKTTSKLPDGDYIVVIGELPAGYEGWANTTDKEHFIDDLGVVTSPETRKAPDTGYAPALALDKDVHNPADSSRIDDEATGFTPPININEGDTVQYTIDVKNTLYDPNSVPTCTRIVWADLGEQGSGTGVQGLTNISASDDQYAQLPIDTQAESIKASGFTGVDTAWGNITALETVLEINNTGYATSVSKHHDVNITTDITYNAGATNEIVETTPNATMEIEEFPNADRSLGEGLWSYDILGTRNITLADLSSVIIEAKVKRGYAETATFDIDAIGLRITTDQSCGGTARDSVVINPVPLTDTFDANQLEFVSASPTHNRLVAYDDSDPTTDMYRIEWDNLADSLGDLGPGQTHSVTVTFKAKQPQVAVPGTVTVNNKADITTAKFKTGTPANTATDDVDTVLHHTATIGDFIWNDADGDGVQDGVANGEPGIPGVEVSICSPAAASSPCAPGDANIVATTTTDATGFYQFIGLTIGADFEISVNTATLPGTGYNPTPTMDYERFSDTADPKTVVADNTSTITNLVIDQEDVDWGFQSAKSLISGSVWEDKNGDADRDSTNDTGLTWTVTLKNSLGVTIDFLTITDPSGYYKFEVDTAGDYYVEVTPIAGYAQTMDDDYGDSKVCGTADAPSCDDRNDTFTVTLGSNYTEIDFAYQTTGSNSIGNRLYSDLNGDGAEQKGEPSNPVEPGIPNVDIFLYEDNGTIPGVLDPSDTLRARSAFHSSVIFMSFSRAAMVMAD